MNKNRSLGFWHSFYLNILLAILAVTLGTPNLLAEEETIPQLSLTLPHNSSQQPDHAPETEPEPLDFSDTGRSGQQTAGETRGEQCGDVSMPLTALVPKSNFGKTVATHPQLWFYVPYEAKNVSKVEFVIQDAERNDISRQTWQPQNVPGYLNASLPETKPALENNKLYRWYFKIYCHDDGDSAPLFVQGWIEKTELGENLTPQVTQKQSPHMNYAQQNLWFDAIDSLLTLLNSYAIAPNNTQIITDWEKLIKAQGVDLELPELDTTDLGMRIK